MEDCIQDERWIVLMVSDAIQVNQCTQHVHEIDEQSLETIFG
jgi:hypothetical protein